MNANTTDNINGNLNIQNTATIQNTNNQFSFIPNNMSFNF